MAKVRAGRGGEAYSVWMWFGALTVLAPIGSVQADPVPWEQVCSAAGNLAGLLAVFRNQGKSAPDAIQAAIARFRDGPGEIRDRAVAAEIARQVYETPALTSAQESASIKAKCLTPTRVLATAVPTEETGARKSVSDLVPIPLQRGVNRIARFGPDGSDADILLTWHDDAPGHGHDVFVVAGADGPDGAITDDPNHGDDMIR
ncbi:MAG: hypothetical protein M3Y41_22255, partial [Pseudomonadota bacterium]|nr:hypothetical protein [Pseudomonadota bacterium]